MKYRTKLYLFFLTISCISTLLALSIIQFQTRKDLFKEQQMKVVSIASSAAAMLDPEALKQIHTSADHNTPAYQSARQVLQKIRDANRTGDLYVKFLYTTKPDPKDPQKFIFLVDPEEKEEDFSPAGTENPGAADDELYNHLHENFSFDEMVRDPWGVWMTGYAPVFDAKGNYVATVGVDVSATHVNQALNRLYFYAAISFLISVLLSMGAAAYLAHRATESLTLLSNATVEIGKANFAYRIELKTGDEFQELGNAMNQMAEGLEEKERLKSGFAHYVSQHVLERIVKAKGSAKLEGERRKITVFFSDIRGFTHFAEQMPPEEVVTLLNEYFKTMLDIIVKHNGMLDKLIGDGIMAEFGAPVEDPEQERNAVLTAVEMYQALEQLRDKWKKEGKPEIAIGIGIHTGEAIVGSIGSEERMQYTAVGDTVNVASRLEQITKEGQYPIIISESTFKALKDEFPYKPLGSMTLPGREHPINAYAILPRTAEAKT
jgi:adenylate cyclase